MDTILINGNVITMALPNKREQALAIDDGRIAKVGSTAAVLALATAHSRVIDLAGKTVMPGLTDTHMHCFLTGLSRVAVGLDDAGSVADVCERIRERARQSERGKWVYATGCIPWNLAEKRYPRMQELDLAAPENPVYIAAVTFHSGATNSRGFGLIDLDSSLSGIGRDDAGQPNGWLLTDDTHFAAAGVAYGAMTDEEIAHLYDAAASFAASRGCTTLHCLDGQFIKGDRDVLVLLDVGARLPVRTHVMYQTMDVQRVLELGLPRIGGCLTIDGAGFDHTALMFEPYADAPNTCGDCYIDQRRINAFVREAHDAGLQIGMHACGDKSVDMLVRAYKEVMEASPREDCRHRVEHYYIPSDWAIEEAQRLGLALPMQPAFAWSWDRVQDSEYARIWGRERADRAEPFARLYERGLVVSGGSDSPVTPIDPLLGIHAAANHPHPARKVPVEEAIRMFTVNAAWVEFNEKEKGTVERGKLADLVVVDGDPFLETERIKDFSVELTIRGGETVFERPGSGGGT